MPFNYRPNNRLTQDQDQLLFDLENITIDLKGNSNEDILVDINDIHSNYVSDVVIENTPTLWFPDEYWDNLVERLNAFRAAIDELCLGVAQSVNNADEHPEGEDVTNGSVQMLRDYRSLLNKIDDIIAGINNGTLRNGVKDETILGCYDPDDKSIHLYLSNIERYAQLRHWNADYILAYVYIHEAFHAFFDRKAQMSGGHYIREIEEPMAECGMLCYLSNAFNQSHRNEFNDIYKTAKQDVKLKQRGHLAAYGFGLYLHNQKDNLKILGEYSQKSSLLDPFSYNVIRYAVELMRDYPAASPMDDQVKGKEGERILYDLLVNLILNVGQHQEMSFEQMFLNMKSELKKSLLERWQPKNAKFDSNYQIQLENIIDQTVSDNILVENMSPWQGATPIYKGGTDYTLIINHNMLKFLPYEHQVKSWKALMSPGTGYKSMVVTTGTGSGKTESFMVPLITDLAGQNNPGCLKAIFLYPLNALMEDQKSKLNDLIEKSGGDLTFAVYNSSTPSWEPDNEVFTRDLSREVIYREEIRGTHHWDAAQKACVTGGGRVPDIILTNPTMLEYMLLRKSDETIINSSQRSLSWIVVDETHTYNGAGADELAMLIRRVLKAFDRRPDEIHFATSSATVGNSDVDLLRFISGITGQNSNNNNGLIKIIKGHRSTPDFSLAQMPVRTEKNALLSKLGSRDYVYLNDLIPYKQTTIERIQELDRLCKGGLKAKVHFYVEALTNGIYANMEDIMNGRRQFQLVTEIPFDTNACKLDSRYVRIVHCNACGTLLANCDVDPNDNYSRTRFVDEGRCNVAIFTQGKALQPNVIPCDIATHNKITLNNTGNNSAVLTLDYSCPYCGSKRLSAFNASSTGCMRSITPVLLDNATKHDDGNHPYYGQQFISFADSRRGAAQPSLEQNLETEEYWVISTLLEKLKEGITYNKVLNILSKAMTDAGASGNNVEVQRILGDITTLNKAPKDENLILQIAQINGIENILSWEGALKALFESTDCEKLAKCFAKDDDWDDQNNLKEDYKRRYVLGALYNVMKRRSKYGFSVESYGIFQTTYPRLKGLTIPPEVQDLNVELAKYNKPEIKDSDWQNYLKIYLDFNVRTNERLFFKGSGDWDDLDIDDCRNLKTTFGLRRSIKEPIYEEGVHYKLLWRLFGCDDEKQLAVIDQNLPSMVDDVVKAMWDALKTTGVVVKGQRYYQSYGSSNKDWHDDKLSKKDQQEHRTNYRLNVADISFCLIENAYKEENVKAILDTTFKGNTPYQDEYAVKQNRPSQITGWNPPYPTTVNVLANYYNNNTVSFLQCKKTENIYSKKPLFIQYEHTAQVHRDMTKQRIQDFRDYDINILACSTTMEMGVDIGELEIVTMSNVPPHPANYKQRAGRAGRFFQNKSTCVTVCNSDAVGVAVLKEPQETLLEREVTTPSADMNSPQVVQRHVNSFLLREFLKTIRPTRTINNYRILDFFLNNDIYDIYSLDKRFLADVSNPAHPIITYPLSYDATLFHSDSFYEKFDDWLLRLNRTNNQPLFTDLDDLKSGTKLAGANTINLIQTTVSNLHDLFGLLKDEFEKMRTSAQAPNLDWQTLKGYAGRLNYDFVSLLKQNLLEFCSTHQFIPNANMPVNIVELKIKNEYEFYDNPSRDLVIALSEYAPGRSVTIDGKNYTIGGVDWDRTKAFRHIHICKNCGYTWDSGVKDETSCPSCANNSIDNYDMIEPTAFLPEQETDRIVDKNSKNVSLEAQLIGTNGLVFNNLTHLCDYVREYPQPNTKILYMNQGVGMGYCVCDVNGCGRAVIETQKQQSGDTQYVRDLMYNEVERTKKQSGQKVQVTSYEHQNLKSFEQDVFNPNLDKIRRNMFIGGSISTNFSILKPYHIDTSGKVPFAKINKTDESILTTLGLVVCDELSKLIPCQRQDIDFLISTFNRGERALCIYDTAKGGAGYSSHLDNNTWLVMLDRCLCRLDAIINGVKGIDSIFTRSTMRYLEDVDIRETYDWLNEELRSRNPIPNAITAVYPQAVRSSLHDIKNAITQATDATLYIQPDRNTWNYELDNASVPSWKDTRNDFKLTANRKVQLAFCGDPGVIPTEAVDIIKHTEDWATFAKANVINNGLYPLAFINGWLYFTDDPNSANYDGLWGNGPIYAAQTPQPVVNTYNPTLSNYHELFIAPRTICSSKGILNVVIGLDGSNTINKFITNARGHQLEFEYMDEHLKNQLGVVIAIQLMAEIAQAANCYVADFKVTFINEDFYDRNGTPFSDPYRRLTDSFQSDHDTRDMIDALLYGSNWDYRVNTLNHNSLPHWRSLTIKDVTNGSVLTIKPHGGVANGWYIDTPRAGMWYDANNTDADTDIPLCSDLIKPIQYSVGIK